MIGEERGGEMKREERRGDYSVDDNKFLIRDYGVHTLGTYGLKDRKSVV